MPTSISDFQLWYYTPNLAAAVIAAIIFSLLTIYHTYRTLTTRTWYCIPFIIGGSFEIVGFCARAAAHSDTTALTPYIIQSLLLLLAPPLFAASIYMILSRIMLATCGPSHSLIRVSLITKIFVTGDIFCFLMQSAGGAFMAIAKGDPSKFQTGENIVLGGLVLQVLVFQFFIVVAGTFHVRLARRPPTKESMDSYIGWQRLMWILYTVSVLITVRNLVRAVEYGMGSDGYLLRNEWVLYIFDALLMIITLLVCTAWYQSGLRSKEVKVEEAYAMGKQHK